MKRLLILLPVIFVLLVSGCASQQPQKPITLLKQGFSEYKFSSDIRDALKINVNAPFDIKTVFNSAKTIDVFFDGISRNDNGDLQNVLFNMLTKLNTYWENSGRQGLSVRPFYYLGDPEGVWINSTGGNTTKPQVVNPTIWLKGPNTNATDTSVKLQGIIAYLSGTSSANLTLAGDRLVLSIFGINTIEDIPKAGFEIVGN